MKYKPTLPTIYEDCESEEIDNENDVFSLKEECLLKVASNWDFFKNVRLFYINMQINRITRTKCQIILH